MKLIESQTVGVGGASSVTLGSGGTIPQTYQHLVCYFSGRAAASGSNYNAMYIRPNNDSNSANYDLKILYAATGGWTYTTVAGTNGLFVSDAAGATSGTFMHGVAKVYILNYASTSLNKNFIFHGSSSSYQGTGLGQQYMEPGSGAYKSTAAITSLLFRHASDATIAEGTKFSLYGLL